MEKVCHITSVHPRYDARILYKECVSLKHAGYDVTLLVADTHKDEVIEGVQIHSIGVSHKTRLERILKSKKEMLSAALKIDARIYHLHDPELLPVGKKLKNLGKKVIFDSHENYPRQIQSKKYIPKSLRHLTANIYRYFETSMVKKFDSVIIPCTFNGNNIFDGRAKKTYILPNYPLLSDFYDKSSSINAKNRNICYVGGLTYDRGIYHLVKAASKADARLFLYGNFMPEAFFEEIRNLPESSTMEYHGYIDHNQIVTELQRASIGMCTLLNKGQYFEIDTLGVKVYEYMSAGLPVIISNSPYALDIIDKYGFGICVDPSDIDAIAETICYLLNNPDIAAQMGENGRKAVKNEFNWEAQEKVLLKLYEDLS